jgi:hypothetical protein
VADGLIAFAKREGITHVVFGQTARARWEILLKKSTLNRVLQEVRGRGRAGGIARRLHAVAERLFGDRRGHARPLH